MATTQTGVVENNIFRDIGRFTNGLLNKCSTQQYEHVARLGNGSRGVIVRDARNDFHAHVQ